MSKYVHFFQAVSKCSPFYDDWLKKSKKVFLVGMKLIFRNFAFFHFWIFLLFLCGIKNAAPIQQNVNGKTLKGDFCRSNKKKIQPRRFKFGRDIQKWKNQVNFPCIHNMTQYSAIIGSKWAISFRKLDNVYLFMVLT